jgi:divinyl protochlorophyllide a 8-vinyl-reductase
MARIGPNAIHQLVAVLDRREGRAARDGLCAIAGIVPPPPDAGLWPEAEAAALHRAVRRALPGRAAAILSEAGAATGDYILAHRIPRPAQWALRRMPRALAARLLARAVAAHAWTFAGSGTFRIAGDRIASAADAAGERRPAPALVFEIEGNPLIAGERADRPLCAWHAAVFARLFSRLVWPEAAVTETCCAARGDARCRFELAPRAMPSQPPRKA